MIGWGPSVLASAVAIALVNLGLASMIALAIGGRGFVPLWVGIGLLVVGLIATVVAVTLWRGYLKSVRDY